MFSPVKMLKVAAFPHVVDVYAHPMIAKEESRNASSRGIKK